MAQPWMDPNTNPPQMQNIFPSSAIGPPMMPIRPKGPPKHPRQLKEGDWECPEPTCGNINFSKRTKCNRCGIPRPRPAVDPLQAVPHFGGPPGLFKQGDWPCAHCGNVNWARREKCNICNAAKPSIKAEPRTGRGGGHFDLQDPADRNIHQSDDEEYDEFGRKKKRKKPTVNANEQTNSTPSCPSKKLDKIEKLNSSTPECDIKIAFPPAPKEYGPASSRSSSGKSSGSQSEQSSSSSSDSDSDSGRSRSRSVDAHEASSNSQGSHGHTNHSRQS